MGRKEDDGVERIGGGVVVVNPKPQKGLSSKAIDLLEWGIIKLMHDSSKPLNYLHGNCAPTDETPPLKDLDVQGHLPECLNGEFVRVGPNSKFAPVAGYHWFDGDGDVLYNLDFAIWRKIYYLPVPSKKKQLSGALTLVFICSNYLCLCCLQLKQIDFCIFCD